MRKYLSQEVRLILAAIYFLLLLAVAGGIFNYSSVFPPLTPNGLWFWAVFASLVGTILLDQPRYTPPASAFLNALGAAFLVAQILADNSIQIPRDASPLWTVYSLVTGAVLVLAGLAIILKRFRWVWVKKIALLFTRLSGLFGSPQAVFGGFYLLLLYSFHRNRPEELFWLFTIWVVFAWQPLERLVPYVMDFLSSLNLADDSIQIGNVLSYRQPGVINFQVTGGGIPKPRSLVAIVSDKDHFQLALVIDNYQLASSRWSRGLVLKGCDRIHRANLSGVWGEPGSILKCELEKLSEGVREKVEADGVYSEEEKFLGVVVEKSNVNSIRVEMVVEDNPITEGSLISAIIRGKRVLYQVIDGVTESELLEQSNRHGYVQVVARKIGEWDQEKRVLHQIPWTPQIYAPVYYLDVVESKSHPRFIGHMPQTDYGIEVDGSELVTHNAAILGVLGTGKTYLALELIERMLNDGIQVWVIDITNQYEEKLSKYVDSKKQEDADEAICSAIEPDEVRFKYYENKAFGGNHPFFRSEIKKHISNFISDDDWKLRVINPNKYKVTEQTDWKDRETRKAGFGPCSPAQITRIVAEELLEALQDTMRPQAKLCIVLEEAHSLVPEWNTSAHDGDVAATNATAKAILQGRKYGFGCLLITQRTAHVTKSILNQCHTVFALQTFDKTGMEFLSNYLGDDYTNLLNTLEPRHCIAYGRALNSRTPLIVKLNDREDFLVSIENENQ